MLFAVTHAFPVTLLMYGLGDDYLYYKGHNLKILIELLQP